MSRLFAILLVMLGAGLLAISSRSQAREQFPGQYAQVEPQMREWFRNQTSPKSGGNCCSEADGEFAEEDIRNGVYWTRWSKSDGKWHEVPSDVVITKPNFHGRPVVWWYWEQNGADAQPELKIRCYAPGGGA